MSAPSRPRRPCALAAPERRRLSAAALVALLAGLAYYALVRGAGAPLAALDPSAGTFPSLAHGFATTLLLLAATAAAPAAARARLAALALGANVALTALLERTLGTFDPNDLVALGAGALAALGYARLVSRRTSPGGPVPRGGRGPAMPTRRAVPLLLAASATMTVATGPDYDHDAYEPRTREPVYLGYAELRQAVRVTGPRALEDVGRVYLYEDTLFLNARNQGVHVIDNADPSNPRPVSFIEIPGSTELAIRDGVLYADSYVDLVAIELGGLGAGPHELIDARQTDVFPWDPYQNVSRDVRFGELDESRGVVIGVEGGE